MCHKSASKHRKKLKIFFVDPLIIYLSRPKISGRSDFPVRSYRI